MPTTILLAALRVAGPGSALPSIDLRLEVIEGRSINDLTDAKVIFEKEVTVPSGGSFEHRYRDPSTGHDHQVSVELASRGGPSKHGDLVAVRLRIGDLVSGATILQNDNLAIDGRMLLALHPVPGTDRQVFLSFTPRVRSGSRRSERRGVL